MDGIAALAGVPDSDLLQRVASIEKENQDLKNSMYLSLSKNLEMNLCIKK